MEKDEPEVVHLDWKRVEDPTRDPPPELVVAEPEPEPKPHIIPRWNDPNPFQTASKFTIAVVVMVAVIAYHLLMRAAGLLGN